MDRRAFIHSFLLAGAAASLGASGAPGQTQAARRRAGWIIPTNKPDRFNLKVMAFNPIPAPDPATWELTIEGLDAAPIRLKAPDLDKLPRVSQSSRLKCVQCWSGRVTWEGFRCQDLLRLTGAKPALEWVRVDCADKYYDFVKVEDLLNPRTLFGLGMNGEALSAEHGAPLRLVIPFKYGYK
jgi:DMSO/TMAO reductase YedYZ molybdopterin-dependent catalytic subunit